MIKTVHPGYIVSLLSRLAKNFTVGDDQITIDNHQSNGVSCIHQARVRLKGDPTTYRMIIAPADAEIFINGDKRPVADAFAQPLGDS